MGHLLHHYWLVMIILAAAIFHSSNCTCHPRDLEALRDFINELSPKPDSWDFNSTGDCCEWEGITCDSVRVTKLKLVSKTISGKLSESLGRLHHLRVLNLSRSFISGSIPPSIFNLTNLEALDLSSNGFTGEVPESLNLPSLKSLSLSSNELNGSLPVHICRNSAYLKLIKLESNRFSGEFPSGFEKCSLLQHLFLSGNELTGNIPEDLFHLQGLSLLEIQENGLSGSLSPALGSNKFNGSLPEHLPSCRQLSYVGLARNHFDGHVPESFKDFHRLSFLSLSNCSLVNMSSTLLILQHCKNLTTLVLTYNFDGESLPDDPSLRFKKLKVLAVPNCRLTGSVPRWLSKSSNLELLDLSWNSLTGAIPNWIGGFTNLFYLDLSNNSFTGEIPKNLTRLHSLISQEISAEEPSLDLPIFLKRSKDGISLQYNHVFRLPPTLELSLNNLSGPIWEEFGNLKSLHVFNLNDNRLSGHIPSSLSGMTSLEVLDLSNNHLSGLIPVSLQKLTFLSKFSVANNSLSGRIPSGGQFQTFPNSSFEGNHVCGDHRGFDCQADTPDLQPPNTSDESDNSGGDFALDFSYGVALGFGLSFVVVIAFRQKVFRF